MENGPWQVCKANTGSVRYHFCYFSFGQSSATHPQYSLAVSTEGRGNHLVNSQALPCLLSQSKSESPYNSLKVLHGVPLLLARISAPSSLTSFSLLFSITSVQPHWLPAASPTLQAYFRSGPFLLLFPFPGVFFTPFRCSLTCHSLHEPSLATFSKIATPLWIVPALSFLLPCLILFLGTYHYFPFYMFCFFIWTIGYIPEYKHRERVRSVLFIAISPMPRTVSGTWETIHFFVE